MTIIRDPVTGIGQSVTADGQAVVRAIAESEVEHASHIGLSYMAHSTYALTGGEEALYLENEDSDRDIVIEDVVTSTNIAGVVSVLEVTSGTATGTVVTPLNLNLGSAKVAQATVYGNASVTGTVDGDIIAAHELAADTPHTFRFNGGLILPKNSAIAVRFATTATGIYVDILFHYEDPSTV